MVKLLTLFLIALSSLSLASNLRIDNRYILNDALIRNQRTTTGTYPIRESEITDSTILKYIEHKSGPIVDFGDSANYVALHARVGGNTGILGDTLTYLSTYYDVNIRGSFKRLEFDLSARNNLDKYSEDVVRDWSKINYTGPYYNTNSKDTLKYSNKKLWDENRFNMVFPFSGGSFEIGHGELSMGPSLFDNMFLGDSTNHLDYYRGDYTFGMFTFSFGMLGLMTDHDLEQKNMAFHRLDFNNSFLNVGFYEGVIFKDRMPLMYAVPVVPFLFSEHYYGDSDNNNMGVDATGYIKDFTVYGNLFIDDMYSLTSFFDDTWWGNKWGATFGGTYTKKLKKDFYILSGAEYTRVMPWVYTHHLDSGILRYTHYGKELGAAQGSDSDKINALLEVGRVGKFSMNATVSKTRKGPVDTFRIHDEDIDGTDRKFLETIEEESLSYRYEIKSHFNAFGVHLIPKLTLGGDDDVFLKNFLFGVDITY